MSLGREILFWSPRILGIGFVLFISLFALDVFTEYAGWAVALPLLIHLIPSLVLLCAIAIAWRYELAGAFVFLGFAALYVWSAGLDRPWSWYAGIALPAAAVGALFLASWSVKRRRNSSPDRRGGVLS